MQPFGCLQGGQNLRSGTDRQLPGYAMSVEFSAWKQEYTLLLKGQMTHRATLGTDPRGNLTRIDNALAPDATASGGGKGPAG